MPQLSNQKGFTVIELTIVLAIISFAIGTLIFSNPVVPLNNNINSDKLVSRLAHARQIAVQSRCPVEVSLSGNDFSAFQQSDCTLESPPAVSAPYDLEIPSLSFITNHNDNLSFSSSLPTTQRLVFLADKTARNILDEGNNVVITLPNRQITVELPTAYLRQSPL